MTISLHVVFRAMMKMAFCGEEVLQHRPFRNAETWRKFNHLVR